MRFWGDIVEGRTHNLADLPVQLEINGEKHRPCRSRRGPCRHDLFLEWLAGHAVPRELPLESGAVIITGARIGPVASKDAGSAEASCDEVQVAGNGPLADVELHVPRVLVPERNRGVGQTRHSAPGDWAQDVNLAYDQAENVPDRTARCVGSQGHGRTSGAAKTTRGGTAMFARIALATFTVLAASGAGLLTAGAQEQDNLAFGGPEDVDYAGAIWRSMVEAGLAGEDAILVRPYEGTEPHGFALATIYDQLDVNGREGQVIVKRNYGPEGVGVEEVLNNPGDHLAAVTIMFQREEGYDPENENWFWAKYLPDGSLDQNPMGAQLAGRVGKGSDQGCIACHSGAPGGDYEFLRDPR